MITITTMKPKFIIYAELKYLQQQSKVLLEIFWDQLKVFKFNIKII